jgi:hypothetical protein
VENNKLVDISERSEESYDEEEEPVEKVIPARSMIYKSTVGE